jgi:hypothetical protein
MIFGMTTTKQATECGPECWDCARDGHLNEALCAGLDDESIKVAKYAIAIVPVDEALARMDAIIDSGEYLS